VASEPELWQRIDDMKSLLCRYGYDLVIRQTHRPGYIDWQDRLKIAAIPFRDTFQGGGGSQ